MQILIAVVVLLALVSLVNLVLTVGVVRRLREHSQKLAEVSAVASPMLDVGSTIEEFSAVTVDGATLRREDLSSGTTVGFFDAHCETCHELLPSFVAEARRVPGGRDRVLAVVRDDNGDGGDLVSPLREIARVVVERRRGPVALAFHVKAVPSFCRLDADRTIIVAGYEPALDPADRSTLVAVPATD